MPGVTFELHQQLVKDCHWLGWLEASHLLLHRDSSVAWCILVPETGVENLLDLPPPQRDEVLGDCKRVSDHLTRHLGYPRINVAWLGNVVSQLHVHVVGRRPGDACWPKPVWGNLAQAVPYEREALDAFVDDACARLGLTPRQ